MPADLAGCTGTASSAWPRLPAPRPRTEIFGLNLILSTRRGRVLPRLGCCLNPPNGLIAEIRESTHRVSKKFGISSRSCTPAADPATGKVWAAIGGTSFLIIDERTGTDKLVTGIPNNADGVAIDHRAKTVVVTSNQSGTNDVYLVSERTQKVTRKIKVGFFPISATIDPVTGNAYIPIAFRGVVTEFHV